MIKELEKLLNSCEFYKSDDGSEYTPKGHFLDSYEKLVTNAESYFNEIEADSIIQGGSLVDDMRQIYKEAGGGERGAFEVIRHSIELLDGGTLRISGNEVTK